jgi:hypothetical protein
MRGKRKDENRPSWTAKLIERNQRNAVIWLQQGAQQKCGLEACSPQAILQKTVRDPLGGLPAQVIISVLLLSPPPPKNSVRYFSAPSSQLGPRVKTSSPKRNELQKAFLLFFSKRNLILSGCKNIYHSP